MTGQLVSIAGLFERNRMVEVVSEFGFSESTEYKTVAIVGPQGCGNSTIANMLFGTQFQERDAANGIHRTTEGVWLAISSAGGSPVLVMDMEGSDGRERGDDTCFENHISLFALVSADVLLISTWAKDVGRETGSGKTLLKNLLQEYLKLCKPPRGSLHKVLMFVFRDCSSRTPTSELIEIWNAELEGIWESIPKSADYASSDLSDFFKVLYEGLPHYELQEEEFRLGVLRMQNRFQVHLPGEEEDQLGYLSPLENDDSSIVAESYESISEVFGPSSDDNSRVLGRELAASWENTWEAIRSHRNLIQTRRMPRVCISLVTNVGKSVGPVWNIIGIVASLCTKKSETTVTLAEKKWGGSGSDLPN